MYFTNYSIKKDTNFPWKVNVELSKTKIYSIEPITLNLSIKHQILKFNYGNKIANSLLQIRKVGSDKWIDMTVIKTTVTINDSYNSSRKGQQYSINLALRTAKQPSVSFNEGDNRSEFWYYYEEGEYEIRAIITLRKNNKRVISNTLIFEVIQPDNKEKEIIEYLHNMNMPQFLFTHPISVPDPYIKHAEYISKNYESSVFSIWARFYILEHMIYNEEYYKKNKSLSSELIQNLRVQSQNNSFFMQKLSIIQRDFAYLKK